MNLKIKIFFTLILAVNVFFIVYYQAFIYRAFFNSDAAIANILAQEIINQASYYPDSWWYVNGDIWTFYKHTLAIVFTLLGFSAYNVHTLVVLSFFAFTLFITYKYLKQIGTDTKGILVAFVGISTLYSPMYAREVFGENAYIWYYTAILGYLYSFYIISYESDKKKVFFAIVAILFLSMVFVAENPSRFAIYFIASLFAPLFFFYEHIDMKYKKVALYFTLSLFLGLIYRYIISFHIHMEAGAEGIYLIPFEELPVHFYRSLVGLLNFYGVSWGGKTHLISYGGIVYVLKLLMLPVIFFAPIIYTFKNIGILTSFQRYTIMLGYISFFIIFGIYSFTSLHLNGLYAAKENIRYIIPFVLVISIANGIVWKFYSPRVKFLLIVSILLSYFSISLTLRKDISDEVIKDRQEVIKVLLENNLTKGYAPYWHSHIFTVLSDNKVEVRPLNDEDDDREAGVWLSSTTWYNKEYVDKNAFILLPKQETEEFEKNADDKNLTKAIKTLDISNYKIYIFDQNPITK